MKTVVPQVIARLGRAIPNGAYPHGILPPQDVLCRTLGVSRTTAREAVSVLNARGMIIVQRKRGTRISPPADWKMIDPDVLKWRHAAHESDEVFLRDLAGLRAFILPAAAEYAAVGAGGLACQEIRLAYEAVQRAEDAAAFRSACDVLSSAIVNAGGNQILGQLAELICVTPVAKRRNWPPARVRFGRRIVTRLMAAVERHDGVIARSAMTEYLNFVDEAKV